MAMNPDNTQWGPARRIDRPAKCITIHLTYAPEGSNLRYFPKIRSMPVKEALPELATAMGHGPDENDAANNRGIDGHSQRSDEDRFSSANRASINRQIEWPHFIFP